MKIFRHFSSVLFFAIFASVVVGCQTIRHARDAQRKNAIVSDDAHAHATNHVSVCLANASLEELVHFALTNRPAMMTARLNVNDARLAMKEIAADAPLASATPWGALDAKASLSYSEQSDLAHFSDLKGKTHRGDPSASLSVNILIYDFGRNAARAKAQAEKVIAAERELVDQSFAVFRDVAKNYFTLLEREALVEVAHTNVEMTAAHLERTENQLEQGLVQPLDVLRARLDLATARENVVAASNDLVVAGANLMSALGLDALNGTATEIFGVRTNILSCARRGFGETTAHADDVFAFARTNAPVMRIARARLRAASADVDYAIADLRPTVSAHASLNWADPLWFWQWGLDAAQTLFSGFKRTTAVDRAVIALEKASVAVEQAEQDLSSAIELAIAARENSINARVSAGASLRQACENLETVREQFRLGDASRVDWADATSAFTTALGHRVSAFYRGQIAEAELFCLTGTSPIFKEEIIRDLLQDKNFKK